MSKPRVFHSRTGTPEYITWGNMIQRCTNPKNTYYCNYGGRGIEVCESWLSFINFYRDMGDKPTPEHTLDRIDNNGPYSLENCRWSSREQQDTNKRSNVWITHDGRTMTLTQWANETGIHYVTITARLSRGWSIAEALTLPTKYEGKTRQGSTLLVVKGVAKAVSQWAKLTGISEKTIRKRLRTGWSLEDALSIPPRPNQRKTRGSSDG